MQDVTVPDMMRAREARAQMQRALLREYPGTVVVCLCMNIAGPVKTNERIERAFRWGVEAVRAVLKPYEALFNREIHEKTGPEAMLCVRADAIEAKRRLCTLEDGEAIGRLLDIDVIAPDGEKVSRTEIGLSPRQCLLCGNPAPVCARSRAHSVDILFARAMEIIDAHFHALFAKRAGEQAQRALLCEVAVTPKPGLVDRNNSGAHEDMDVFTFIDSACALRCYFSDCAAIGLSHRGGDEGACFEALRVPGLLAEAEMERATGGVNTHKGAVFSLGIACAALGMTQGQGTEAALLCCGRMTKARMMREMDAAQKGNARTFGELALKNQNVGGIRKEAADGFPSVRMRALPRLRKCLQAGMSYNDAGLCAIVTLMADTQDTNVLKRGGEEGLKAMHNRARTMDRWIEAALEDGSFCAETLHKQMEEWDRELSAQRISPGGCADLLALTFLMDFAERINENCEH